MKRRLRNQHGIMLVMSMLAVACSSPLLISNWKDPAYKAKPSKIMVVSMDRNPLTRMYFEEKFAEKIKANGANAIASYTVLTSKEQNDPEAIMTQIRALGADTVLVTRLLSKEIAQTQKGAATKPKWQDYYGYDKQSLYPLGVIAEEGYAVLETRLYDANIKLIWSVTSKTALGGAYQQRIESYIDTMIWAMSEQGLLHS